MSARRPPRPRRRRSLTAQLAAVVLGFEAIVVFLGGLVVFGLRALPDAVAPWWGVAGGIALAVAMIVTAGRVHTRAGIITGWILQGLVAAAGILVPAMLIVGLLFGGMWAFATIQGPRIEARTRASEGE